MNHVLISTLETFICSLQRAFANSSCQLAKASPTIWKVAVKYFNGRLGLENNALDVLESVSGLNFRLYDTRIIHSM